MTEHYFTATPTSVAATHPVAVRLAGREVTLQAAPGVFSGSRLDPGTAVLLEHAPAPSGGRLLDLGCGYGPIAIGLALAAPTATVTAVDVNARARELTARNAAALGLAVTVAEDADGPYDEIWSNPPIRIGKAALHDLLTRWLGRLAPDGVAWLVVQRNLGADSLQRWLLEQGFDAARSTSVRGYRVLRVSR